MNWNLIYGIINLVKKVTSVICEQKQTAAVEAGSLHATNYLTLCLRFQIYLSGIILIRIRSVVMNIFALGL